MDTIQEEVECSAVYSSSKGFSMGDVYDDPVTKRIKYYELPSHYKSVGKPL